MPIDINELSNPRMNRRSLWEHASKVHSLLATDSSVLVENGFHARKPQTVLDRYMHGYFQFWTQKRLSSGRPRFLYSKMGYVWFIHNCFTKRRGITICWPRHNTQSVCMLNSPGASRTCASRPSSPMKPMGGSCIFPPEKNMSITTSSRLMEQLCQVDKRYRSCVPNLWVIVVDLTTDLFGLNRNWRSYWSMTIVNFRLSR